MLTGDAFLAAARQMLPLHLPLNQWTPQLAPLQEVSIGICRHPVVFIALQGEVYAVKEMPDQLAQSEYELLERLREAHVPAVIPVAHYPVPEHQCSLLFTHYLAHSVPYRLLFISPTFDAYRGHLLDAVANLLVELHLKGVFWGDCSLSNTLFRQDAGYLQAYLVDAETTEIHPTLSEGLRAYDLDIMEENFSGALADLAAEGKLPTDYPIFEAGVSVRQRYDKLWQELSRIERVAIGEKYKIQERVRKLNALGFSVEQVFLESETDEKLKFQVRVADRQYHRNQLQRLIGLEAEEQQALLMLNEIQEMRTELSHKENRSVPLSTAAQHWFQSVYQPIQQSLSQATPAMAPVEIYCLMLEHKWYLSESAQCDVGHQQALSDYLTSILKLELSEKPA